VKPGLTLGSLSIIRSSDLCLAQHIISVVHKINRIFNQP
jgi:hypothetical protein